MPFNVTYPAKDLATTASRLGPTAERWTEDCSILARDVLRSYTPNRGKKLLYAAVEQRDRIPSGWGVGGPQTLLPNPEPAPRGTITEFLSMHPE